ncbi:MAG: CvpA family protein [Alistipes sp.]|nr:CvpA family protein [Alistipes sp.]
MIVFDIITGLLLLLALYNGFRRGFFIQLAGLAGLFIGAWLAMRFGGELGRFLCIDGKYAAPAGFLIILLLVILAMAGVGRMFKGVFKFAGLSLLDKLAGLVLSLAKTVLVLGLVLWGFDTMNRPRGWVDPSELERSVFYRPLVDVTVFVFPYIVTVDDLLAPLYRVEPSGQPAGPSPEPTAEPNPSGQSINGISPEPAAEPGGEPATNPAADE